MPIKTALLALCSVGLATGGQLLLKAGMSRVGFIGSERLSNPFGLLFQVLKTWQVPVGLAVFFISAGFWLLVLSRVPLSFAYPFVGLTYVLITLFGKFVLHESVPGLRWVGLALIVSGILIVGRTSPSDAPPGSAAAVTAPSQR
ncbi:MAG: EamA family transporter [Actinomycetota bacterium]